MAKFRIRELIKEARDRGAKVTQTTLAEAAGVAVPSIWKIAEGKTKAPDPQILLAIAEVFTEALGRGITIDDLIEKEDKETPDTPPESEPPAELRTIDDKIDDINEQLEGIRNEIAGVRTELSQLNQNHVEHLEHHNRVKD